MMISLTPASCLMVCCDKHKTLCVADIICRSRFARCILQEVHYCVCREQVMIMPSLGDFGEGDEFFLRQFGCDQFIGFVDQLQNDFVLHIRFEMYLYPVLLVPMPSRMNTMIGVAQNDTLVGITFHYYAVRTIQVDISKYLVANTKQNPVWTKGAILGRSRFAQTIFSDYFDIHKGQFDLGIMIVDSMLMLILSPVDIFSPPPNFLV